MSQANIKLVQYAVRAIQESIQEAVKGEKAYDFRTLIEQITVTFDDCNPKRIMVNFELKGMANQVFPILLDGEKDET